MVIDYNIPELEKALNDFYKATGSATILTDTQLNTVAGSKGSTNCFCELVHKSKKGEERCKKSDFCLAKKCVLSHNLETHICHAGLIDAAVPIDFKDDIVGYIILGQMRSNTDFNEIYDKISDLPIEFEEAKLAYESLSVSSQERMESVVNIAKMLTQYILFKNLISEYKNAILTQAVTYISLNLDKDLSIESICECLNVSKSVLYRSFHKYMNCTVGEYINNKRIEYAKSMILNTTKSLQEISDSVGFSDYTYFCKIFKKTEGITPFKYKKLIK